MARSPAIAVVGLDCVLPGAASADAWIQRETPAFRAVPEGRWPMDPSTAIDPTPGALDKASCDVGAFVDTDHLPHIGDVDGIPVDSLDPVFRLSVSAALHVHWERVGQPDTRAIRERWEEGQ